MPTPARKLPMTLEKFVAAQFKQGTYRSREAAIIAAIASDKRRAEQRTGLSSEIQKGLDSGAAGSLDSKAVIRSGSAKLASRKRRRTA